MKKVISSLMLTLIMLFSITSITYAEGNYYKKDVKVYGSSYGSIEQDEEETLTLEFNYEWITKNSNTAYNNELAKAAILLASNAYSDVYVSAEDTPDPTDKKSVLKELGIDDSDIKYELYSEDNYDIDELDKGLDVNDIAGITMGYKLIEVDDETYNVFIFIPDSTEGLSEWESNFDIGAGMGYDDDDYQVLTGRHPDWTNHYNHKGFDVTATREKRIIDKFINEKRDPSYKTSILLCGHSRGAAVSNIISKNLIDEDNDYKIYAYTFGTPNTTERNNSSYIEPEDYKQIFNHINDDDFVTTMPSENWNFTRYGQNIYSRISSSNELKLLYNAIVSKDSEVIDEPNIPETYNAPQMETTYDEDYNEIIGVKDAVGNLAESREDFYKVQTRKITYTGTPDEVASLIVKRKGENDELLGNIDALMGMAGIQVPYIGLYSYSVTEDGIEEYYRQAFLLRSMANVLGNRSDYLSMVYSLLIMQTIEDRLSNCIGDETEANTQIDFVTGNHVKEYKDFLSNIIENANNLSMPHTTASYYAMTLLRDYNCLEWTCPYWHEYTGEEIIPEVTITDIAGSWEKDIDYKLECDNNINPGIGDIYFTSLKDYFDLSNPDGLLTKTNLQENTQNFVNNLEYSIAGSGVKHFYINEKLPEEPKKTNTKKYKVTKLKDTAEKITGTGKKGSKRTITPVEGRKVSSVIVTDSDGNKIDVAMNDDGTYSFIQPAKNVNVEIIYKNREITLNIGSTEASVDEEKSNLDVCPVIRNDRTMLPIRFVAENLGAIVEWNELEANMVYITKGDIKIEIKIGSDIMKVNGKEVKLDSVAFAENDRTYLPVRAISEALNAIVEWNEDKPMEVKIYER